MKNINRRTFLSLGGAGVAYAVLPGGCGKDNSKSRAEISKQTKATDLKMLVLGVDDATFEIIEPMVADGKLPAFKRLMDTETYNGFTISDRVAYSRWSSWTNGRPSAHLTSPGELFDEIKELVVNPQNPPIKVIEHLVRLTTAEKEKMLAAMKPLFACWLTALKYGYCSQRIYEKIALHMLKKGQPDLAMVFLIGIEPVCHTFLHFFKPWQFPEKVDIAKAKRLGKLIPAIYEHTDNFLKELLSHSSQTYR